MDNLDIKSVDELYRLILPALKSKIIEIKNNGIDYIKEIDIFEYLRKNIWNYQSGLTLYDLVDDIFSIDINVIKEYVDNNVIYRKFDDAKE